MDSTRIALAIWRASAVDAGEVTAFGSVVVDGMGRRWGKPEILPVGLACPPPPDAAGGSSKVRRMRGLHLTADLYNCRCDPQWLTDAHALSGWARQAAETFGLEVSGDVVNGRSVALLLAQSHVCLHTWPAERGATIDVHVAGAGEDMPARARGLMDALVGRFTPEWTEQRSLDRGTDAP
jgi:S-adenosylmethionine decarboxylase